MYINKQDRECYSFIANSEQPCSAIQIANLMHKSLVSVQKYLQKLIKANKVIRIRDGRHFLYALPTSENKEVN